jgi:hypothetical protein
MIFFVILSHIVNLKIYEMLAEAFFLYASYYWYSEDVYAVLSPSEVNVMLPLHRN